MHGLFCGDQQRHGLRVSRNPAERIQRGQLDSDLLVIVNAEPHVAGQFDVLDLAVEPLTVLVGLEQGDRGDADLGRACSRGE